MNIPKKKEYEDLWFAIRAELSIIASIIYKNSQLIETDLQALEDSLKTGYEADEDSEIKANKLYWAEITSKVARFNNSRILNSSMLIYSYSLFEVILRDICTVFEKIHSSKISAKDLNGMGIEQSRNFLKLVAEIDLTRPQLNSLWDKIKQYATIRNLIVHRYANFVKEPDKPLEKQKMYNYIKDNEYLEFEEGTGKFYIIDKQYNLIFLGLAQNFTEMILLELDKKN